MKKNAFPLTIGTAMVLTAMLVAPAQAQRQHTWVAALGIDSASCGGRTTPCATFQGAINRTDAGGEVMCADSGNYGSVTITTSITINCEYTIGSFTGLGGPFIFVNNTASSDVVTLRGLDLDGLGGGSCSGPCGLITFNGAGVLHVDKMKITNERRSFGTGILFVPSGPARLDVSDSFIADNGTNVSSAGILIKPSSGGTANVSVSRTYLKGNVNGIFVDGSGGGGPVNLNVHDSVVTGSSNVGIVLATPSPALTALIDRATVTSSLNVGVAVSGAAATVRLGNSTIYGNVTGVAAVSGGSLRSFKNNQIKGNLTDGTPIAAAEGLD